MGDALNLTREQLEKLNTPRLLNVLKRARKSNDCMRYAYQCGEIEYSEAKQYDDYFELVKSIADTREHIE